MEDELPAFDVRCTPSYQMGSLAEHVRASKRSIRSAHPQTSFVALGDTAAQLMAVHDLQSHLGERSPLAALFDADADVLLLGVGYSSCTAFHLAEHRLPTPPAMRPYRCYVSSNGERERVDFVAPHLDDTDFPALGADFERSGLVRAGPVGGARARLFRIRDAVEFAIGWMAENRGTKAPMATSD